GVPATNMDGSTPANLLGYNLYRAARAQNEPAQTPLNNSPLTTNRFSDQTFNFGEEYVYVVRAVSLGTGGTPVESLNSNAILVTPLDTFPPSAPATPTAAASLTPLRVSVFFAVNPERDVRGYNVFRSEDPNLPKERWTKLNRNLLERNTFQDDDVRRGTKYFYYVTAVDEAGNVSSPSEVTSDAVP
ncbi:MAG: fibronectin type III domain-containing protein, partial [Acidobacteria bacterium]|nr:fibronectin type III domain-containing protein [Acidobacteriota bacterium]